MIEPPGLEEEMSGGGSDMVSGLTAASLLLSCGRPESEGWPPCWNAVGESIRWGYDHLILRCSGAELWLTSSKIQYHNKACKANNKTRQQGRKLTVQVEQVLFMTNFGHVSWRHGVGGENWATQAGGPQIIRAQRLLLGLTMRGECPGLFCNDTNRVRMTKNNWAQTNVTSSQRRFPSVPCLCKHS